MKKRVIISALLASALLLSGCSSAPAVSESQSLFIPLETVTETASFYPVTVDGTKMEVLAVLDSSGNVRTAFNTCESCYDSGNGRYTADGTEIVCGNCGFRFTADEVGLQTRRGGCNPYPITDENRTVTDTGIEIPYDFLKASKSIFAEW